MKRAWFATCLAVLWAVSAPAGAHRQTSGGDLSSPGPEHAVLDLLAGSWNVTIVFPDGRGGQLEGRATCEAVWTVGGRFLRQVYRSSFGGKPLEVVRYLGFDRHRGRYLEVHFESTHTDMLLGEGSIDVGRRVMTATGTHMDILAGRPAKVRTVTTIVDRDAFTLTMEYLDTAGQPARVVTLRHRRASARPSQPHSTISSTGMP